MGLKLVGIGPERQQNVVMKTNLEDFTTHFGSKPQVCASIWEALQATQIDEARIYSNSQRDFHYFMLSFLYLKTYPKEKELKRFGIHEQTARKWTEFYIKKIAALKP
eukprot:scaffold2150_cov144-Amphora_coffeaeformis.AAC.1